MTAEERTGLRYLISETKRAQVNAHARDRLDIALNNRARKERRRRERESRERQETFRMLVSFRRDPVRGQVRCPWCGKRCQKRTGCPEHRDLTVLMDGLETQRPPASSGAGMPTASNRQEVTA